MILKKNKILKRAMFVFLIAMMVLIPLNLVGASEYAGASIYEFEECCLVWADGKFEQSVMPMSWGCTHSRTQRSVYYINCPVPSHGSGTITVDSRRCLDCGQELSRSVTPCSLCFNPRDGDCDVITN